MFNLLSLKDVICWQTDTFSLRNDILNLWNQVFHLVLVVLQILIFLSALEYLENVLEPLTLNQSVECDFAVAGEHVSPDELNHAFEVGAEHLLGVDLKPVLVVLTQLDQGVQWTKRRGVLATGRSWNGCGALDWYLARGVTLEEGERVSASRCLENQKSYLVYVVRPHIIQNNHWFSVLFGEFFC